MHIITLVTGVNGLSVYINNYRIAGPKPWGGGQHVKEWKVEASLIQEALKMSPASGKEER